MKALKNLTIFGSIFVLAACGNTSLKEITYEKAQTIASRIIENQEELINTSPVKGVGSFSFKAEQKQHETLNGEDTYDYSSKMNSTFNTKKAAFRAEMTFEETDNGEKREVYISQTVFLDNAKGLIMAEEDGEEKTYYVAYSKSDLRAYANEMQLSVIDVANLMISGLAYQVILENMFQPSILDEIAENPYENFLSDINDVSLKCYSKGKENLKVELSGSYRKSPLYYDTVTEMRETIEWNGALVTSMTADFSETGTYSRDEIVDASYTFTQNDKTEMNFSSNFESISLDEFTDVTDLVK